MCVQVLLVILLVQTPRTLSGEETFLNIIGNEKDLWKQKNSSSSILVKDFMNEVKNRFPVPSDTRSLGEDLLEKNIKMSEKKHGDLFVDFVIVPTPLEKETSYLDYSKTEKPYNNEQNTTIPPPEPLINCKGILQNHHQIFDTQIINDKNTKSLQEVKLIKCPTKEEIQELKVEKIEKSERIKEEPMRPRLLKLGNELDESRKEEGNARQILVNDDGVTNYDISNFLRMNDRSRNISDFISIPSLSFDPVPEGDPFNIEALGLTEGVFVFTYLGQFLSWIQPYDFPVELARDVLWNRVSIINLIFQSLKVEVGFITCLVIGLSFALFLPVYVVIFTCVRLCSKDESYKKDKSGFKRRSLWFLYQVTVIIASAGVIAMFITNEQLSGAVQQTPDVLNIALNDISTYVRNSHQQVRFLLTKSFSETVDATVKDIDDITELLGKPIQKEIAVETGIDVALDTLLDVAKAVTEISYKIEKLQNDGSTAKSLIVSAKDRLYDISSHVEAIKRKCSGGDKALCDTIDSSGLDVRLRFDSILVDPRLNQLRSLRDQNLTQVAESIKNQFHLIPEHINIDTLQARADIKRYLARQKSILDDSLWPLENVARQLRRKIEDAREMSNSVLRQIPEVEYWRWLAKLSTSLCIFVIWSLYFSVTVCSCCGGHQKSKPTLILAILFNCLLSVFLWIAALCILLIGGHGEVFVCRPLYDSPSYDSLTRLVDNPGILYESKGGFFPNLLSANTSLDVQVRNVLRDCETNSPLYLAFKLDNIFNINNVADYHSWNSIQAEYKNLELKQLRLELLSPEFQTKLQELMFAMRVNLTSYRSQLSRPVTEKDLMSFSKQLESVSNQVKDLSTASKLETLASRIKKTFGSLIQPLERKKDELIYELTAVEVQLAPLQKQVNQSLSHLRTIQYFINNQGSKISNKKSQDFIGRLTSYLNQFRQHVFESVQNNLAPCKPVWNSFTAVRSQLCRHLMDPLNGFWFAAVWCLLCFTVIATAGMRLLAFNRGSRDSLIPSSNANGDNWGNDNSPPRGGW